MSLKRSDMRRDGEGARRFAASRSELQKSRKPLRQSHATLPPAEREQATRFHEAVQGRACARCGKTRPVMEAHHAIEAQFLRDRHPEHVYDVRNAVPLCPWWVDPACHGDHTSRLRPLHRSMLPESVEEFAAELGLDWYLEQRYVPVGASQ